jgi:hypothetical protein
MAAIFLDALYSLPTIPAASIPAPLLSKCKDLRLMFDLRQRLANMRSFILTCKNKRGQLLDMLGERLYMLNDTVMREEPPPPPSARAAAAAASSEGPTTGAPGASASSPASGIAAAVASPRSARQSSRSRHAERGGGGAAARAVSPFSEEVEDLPALSMQDDLLLDPADSHLLHPSLHDQWSLQDLVETLSGTLAPRIRQIVKALTKHITSGVCEICVSKGFFCGCRECHKQDQTIFPFQLEFVTQCALCGHCAHKECMAREGCPKCERIALRKAAQQQRIAAAKQALAQHARGGSIGGSVPYIGTGSPVLSSFVGSYGAAPSSSSLLSSPSSVGVVAPASLIVPSPAASSRSLGFVATGGPGSSRHGGSGGGSSENVVATLERTRGGGTRGSSPVRKLNEKIAERKRQQQLQQRDQTADADR